MKLKEFLAPFLELAKNPAYLELDVICSSDDEGNGFQHVFYNPTLGVYTGDHRGNFETTEVGNKTKPNAICIN